jgi:hypothetical protein
MQQLGFGTSEEGQDGRRAKKTGLEHVIADKNYSKVKFVSIIDLTRIVVHDHKPEIGSCHCDRLNEDRGA